MFGLYVILGFLLLSFIGPLFSPYDYFTTDLTVAKQGPSAQHWMGTDTIGRDVLTRILYGGRTALLVGLMVVGLSTGMGILLGGISAYAGGAVDTIITVSYTHLQPTRH